MSDVLKEPNSSTEGEYAGPSKINEFISAFPDELAAYNLGEINVDGIKIRFSSWPDLNRVAPMPRDGIASDYRIRPFRSAQDQYPVYEEIWDTDVPGEAVGVINDETDLVERGTDRSDAVVDIIDRDALPLLEGGLTDMMYNKMLGVTAWLEPPMIVEPSGDPGDTKPRTKAYIHMRLNGNNDPTDYDKFTAYWASYKKAASALIKLSEAQAEIIPDTPIG